MSVLIKGMEMPKNCNKCPLHFYEGQGICSCRALPAIEDDEILKPWKHKRKDCPLVPVPPHGRLIDADALIKSLSLDEDDAENGASLVMAIFLEVLKAAPAVIPASEEGEA